MTTKLRSQGINTINASFSLRQVYGFLLYRETQGSGIVPSSGIVLLTCGFQVHRDRGQEGEGGTLVHGAAPPSPSARAGSVTPILLHWKQLSMQIGLSAQIPLLESRD